jgi:DNA processing protein
MIDLVDFLRLHLATRYHQGVGRRLLETFGSAKSVFRAPTARLGQVQGVTLAVTRKLGEVETARLAVAEVRRAMAEGGHLLRWGTPEYPPSLRPLAGMPLVLYALGQVAPSTVCFPDLSLGVVGSRRPSPYGLAQTRRFVRALTQRGLCIVSGLANGVDAEAHRTALEEEGHTVAVLGSGLGRVYPPENRALASRIRRDGRGCLITEFPFDAAPKSFHFPMRNRVLSGLSCAVLVVEAGEKSGSLITVNHALDQGKSVYVLPGRVDRPEAQGCLRLLMEGAAPVVSPDDVLPGVEVPRDTKAGATAAEVGMGRGGGTPRLSGPFGARLEALLKEEDTWHPDHLAARFGVPAATILTELGRLELEGELRRFPGGVYGRM